MHMNRMKRAILIDLSIDFAIFILSVIVLSFAATKQYWILFWISAALSSIAYLYVLWSRLFPLHQRIEKLVTTNARLAAKAEKYGIVDFFNMQDESEKNERNVINGRIAEEGNFFGLLCETGSSYFNPELNRHWPIIQGRLERQDTIQLLIINPTCQAKRLRKELGIGGDVDLARIQELTDKYRTLDVRFTDEAYCSVFFSEREMLYDPYHLAKVEGKAENHLLAIHLKKQDGGDGPCHYQLLKEHFGHLWSRGISLPQFIQDREATQG